VRALLGITVWRVVHRHRVMGFASGARLLQSVMASVRAARTVRPALFPTLKEHQAAPNATLPTACFHFQDHAFASCSNMIPVLYLLVCPRRRRIVVRFTPSWAWSVRQNRAPHRPNHPVSNRAITARINVRSTCILTVGTSIPHPSES